MESVGEGVTSLKPGEFFLSYPNLISDLILLGQS